MTTLTESKTVEETPSADDIAQAKEDAAFRNCFGAGVQVGMERGRDASAAFVFELARLRGCDIETAAALRDALRTMPLPPAPQ